MDGFEKIELSNASQPGTMQSTASPSQRMRRTQDLRKPFGITAAVIVVLVLFVVLGVVIPGLRLAAQVKKTQAQAQAFSYVAKQQNVAAASDQLDKTKTELLKTQSDLHAMGYLTFIPVLSWYYHDADHLVNAGLDGLAGGRVLIDAIAPYADVLGLKGQGSFTGGSAQQRIQTAVSTLGKVTPRVDDMAGSIVAAQKEMDMVDVNHYPNWLGLGKMRSQLVNAKTVLDETSTFVQQAKPLIKVLPSLLGDPDDANYLVLFQNNAELRPTGGFITAYAIFRINHGVIKVDSSNDIYTLDASIPNKPSAPRPIALYLPQVPQLNVRDTNLSPDFVTSMDTFNQLYKRSSMYKGVNGVIAIDTHVLVSAMNILGDMQVDGLTMTTKENPTCHCADVIYQLESTVDQPVNYVKSNRKGIVGDLMYAIMQKAFSSSPKIYWGPLFQTLISETAQKHIQFDVYNQDAMAGLNALGATGQIKPFDGDYLAINEANFGGAKSNLFITETVADNYQVDGDGSVTKTVTINYKNPYAPSDCNLERGGLCLNATLRDWLRLYVPKGSQLVSFNGSEVKPTSYDELGKTVFDGFLTVRPLGSSTVTITYKLPFKIAGGSPLPALIQKQAGTDQIAYTVNVNGRQFQSFNLLTDTTLKITH